MSEGGEHCFFINN